MGRRNREKSGAKLAEKPPTVMKFVITKLDKFLDKLVVSHGEKFNWTTHVYRGEFYNEEYLVFDLFCHCQVQNWTCDARAEVRIWQKTTHIMTHHFELKKNCISCPPFIKFQDLVEQYERDGQVEFEIIVTEIPKKIQKNASVIVKEYPGIRNFEIHVGKSKFFVNRELLGHTSKFFYNEMDVGRINSDEPYVIEDVTPTDFKLYLDLTYHPKQYFSAYYAKDMILVAKRFQNNEIISACQNVILEDLKENKLSTKDRAKLADTYDRETVEELFKPEALVPASNSRPRFMTVDPEKSKKFTPLQINKISNFITGTLLKYREQDDYVEPAPPDSDIEEIEDIDQSIPSTSGCSHY